MKEAFFVKLEASFIAGAVILSVPVSASAMSIRIFAQSRKDCKCGMGAGERSLTRPSDISLS